MFGFEHRTPNTEHLTAGVAWIDGQTPLDHVAFIAIAADTSFMTAVYIAAQRPDDTDVVRAGEVLPHVRDYLATHHDDVVRLVVTDDQEALDVPRSAVELLARVLAHMAAGQGVSIVPANAELTTQQAADLMNVSRPFLIGLLNAGEIEFRTVGKHRRIKAESLMEYLAADDRKRREAADKLTQLNQGLGLH